MLIHFLVLNNPVLTVVYDCCVCSSPIDDPMVFRIDDQYFHDACLNCSECHVRLHDRCYARGGGVYCKEHCFTYVKQHSRPQEHRSRLPFRKFGNTCASCGYGISATEVVRRANEFVYHLACFACLICHQQLKTGNEFYLVADQQLVCRADYESLKNKGKMGQKSVVAALSKIIGFQNSTIAAKDPARRSRKSNSTCSNKCM